MNPIVLNRSYYPILDVLRGFAILLVFFSHTFSFLHPFEFGWIGVDLFFVLSGFLITEGLLNAKSSKNYFQNFYIRRFLRIFPLYYFVLIFFFYISPSFFSSYNAETYNYYKPNQLWFWTHLQNWLFVEKGMPHSPILSHFWSLAIEEQFYLVWPFIIYLINKTKTIRLTILFLILAALVTRVILWSKGPTDFTTYYCNTLTRMDSILLGCLVAIWKREGRAISMQIIVLVQLICIFYFTISLLIGKNLYLTNPFFATVGYTIVSIFFATLLYVFVNFETTVAQFLQKIQPLKYLGKISYGIYVFHIPIYLFLANFLAIYLKNYHLNSSSLLLIIGFSSLAITLLMSSLSFYLFERPILSLKKYFL